MKEIQMSREWEMSELVRRLEWFSQGAGPQLAELKEKVLRHRKSELTPELETCIHRLKVPSFLKPVVRTEVQKVLAQPRIRRLSAADFRSRTSSLQSPRLAS
jgi:hypothetical protein